MKFPIKYKLASIALLSLVPLLIFGMYHSNELIEHGKNNIKSGNLLLAARIANELDDLIDSTFATLLSLAKHPAVISKNTRACDRLFKELLPSYPDHLNILAAGMDGNNYGNGVYEPGVHKLNYNDAYKAHPGIALLILDVIMPGKNGKEVYAEIKGLRPDIRALFMSGYTANIIHKKGILPGRGIPCSFSGHSG